MRTQIVLTFGLISLFIISLGICASADLVCYLPFDEGSGKGAKDLSGKGNNGQLISDPKWVDGKDGTALQFSSDSKPNGSWVEIPDMGAIGKGSFTVMAWYKIEAQEAADHWKMIMSTGSCCWNQSGFYLCVRPGGQITFEMTETHNTGGKAVNFNSNTLDGQWHHIAGVYQLAQKGSLYVDGKKSGDDADMSGWKDGVASDRPLRIGEYFWEEGARGNFDGVIDEVALFDEVLTEAEIVAAMELESLLPYKAVNSADKLTATWGSIKVGR